MNDGTATKAPVTHALFLAVPPKRNLRFHRCLGNGGGVSYTLAESLDFATPKKMRAEPPLSRIRFGGTCMVMALEFGVLLLHWVLVLFGCRLVFSFHIVLLCQWTVRSGDLANNTASLWVDTWWGNPSPNSLAPIADDLQLSPSNTSTRVCNTRTATRE